MLKLAVLLDVLLAISVAVMKYVWVPIDSEPSGAEKFSPPVAAGKGPLTFNTVVPSICSVEFAMGVRSDTFQVILFVGCEIATWLMTGPVALTLNVLLIVETLPALSVAVIV